MAMPMENEGRPVKSAEVNRRREVLRALRAAPNPLSIVAIADSLDVHPNTVRFHLEHLVRDGQAEQVQPDYRGPGRPPLMFRATSRMDRGGIRQYRLLAEILTTALATERNPRAKAVAAGQACGRQLEAVPSTRPGARARGGRSIERLVDVLDELGFEPDRRKCKGQELIGLRHCPFLELAEKHADVVCAAHLGLMQGAMQAWGAPVSVDRLDPLVEPDLCLAHLSLKEVTQ
jgi:predicted ArsR family transcriptional regulator